MATTRTESDSFGPIEVPSDALWAAQTARSLQFFAIGEQRMPLQLVSALAWIKWAAARVNRDLGLLAPSQNLSALAKIARKFRKKSRGKTAAAFEAAAQTLDAERAARAPVDVQAAHTGLKDLLALAQVWPEPSARQIRRGARRLAGKARRAFRRARTSADETLRHDWRKREKDRLYAVELLGPAWPARRRRRASQKLGETLGCEHDVCLLLTRMDAAPILANEERASARATLTLERTLKRLRRKADALGARVHLSKR